MVGSLCGAQLTTARAGAPARRGARGEARAGRGVRATWRWAVRGMRAPALLSSPVHT